MILTVEIDDNVANELERKAREAQVGLTVYISAVLSVAAAEAITTTQQRNLGYGEGRG